MDKLLLLKIVKALDGEECPRQKKINEISDESLKEIEHAIKAVLTEHQIALLDKEFVCRSLPEEVAAGLRSENHNEGSLYLHGLFQKTD